mmetsp:Transcript_29813/g.55931  ORF Transcript_29813/g.55931 Transcript_29813/m.55931 type:complete len:126 (+) Transcript_29813:682-1059(+)
MNTRIILLASFVAFIAFHESNSFSLKPTTEARRTTSSATAIRWSLQMPDMPFPKSTWYNEVDNPTARRIEYYDDDPNEFRFSTVGSNWPDYTKEEEQAVLKPRRWRAPRINPFQRARNWIRGRRR